MGFVRGGVAQVGSSIRFWLLARGSENALEVKPMKTKTVRKIHTYLGVGTALFLILTGLTGTLLTFRGEFRKPPVVVPDSMQGQPQEDLETLMLRAKEVMGAEMAWIRFSTGPSKPVQIRFRDEVSTTLYYSPSGQLIARRDRAERSLVGWMFDLHTGAILGRPGELVMALVGLLLAVSSVTGFLIWPFLLRRKRSRQLRAMRMAGA